MNKAYKFRIYPNKKQKEILAKTFGCCRFVYNYYLANKIALYKTSNTTLTYNQCCSDLTQLKKKLIWLKEVDKFALTNSIYDLDAAYKNFFRRLKQGSDKLGFPKFKSKKNHYYSYKTNFTNNNIKVDFQNNKIQLPKLKWIKCKLHRHFLMIVISQN